MTSEKPSYPKLDYNEHARGLPRDDFWGQVKRTVNGQPVSEEQITMIVTAIAGRLHLQADDILLDLACGNGALSVRLFDRCRGFLGVDLSDYLISVAQEYFERAPDYRFLCSDGSSFLRDEPSPERFTKVLCYGAVACFSDEQLRESLMLLNRRFTNVSRVFIGNAPDKERAHLFYTRRQPEPGEIDDHTTAVGKWRTRRDYLMMAEATGWTMEFLSMPEAFYGAAYRYDLVLTRKA